MPSPNVDTVELDPHDQQILDWMRRLRAAEAEGDHAKAAVARARIDDLLDTR